MGTRHSSLTAPLARSATVWPHWQVGREQATATPVLGSLLRLGGEGNADALARLVEVAAVAKDDDGLTAELTDPFAEIARNAPDELIVAFKASGEAVSQLALDLLARSLAKAAADHPFPAALKKARAAPDAQLAAFAKGLEEDLQARLAASKDSPDGGTPASAEPLPPARLRSPPPEGAGQPLVR